MLKKEKITGGVLVVKVNHNRFAMVLIAAQISHHFNIQQQSQKPFIFAPANTLLINLCVMEATQNFDLTDIQAYSHFGRNLIRLL
jgi:hypothetical protein